MSGTHDAVEASRKAPLSLMRVSLIVVVILCLKLSPGVDKATYNYVDDCNYIQSDNCHTSESRLSVGNSSPDRSSNVDHCQSS